MSKSVCYLAIVCALFVVRTAADTPANCTYDDIQGTWLFSESERSAQRNEKCNGSEVVVNKVRVQLLFPNTAVDEFGNKGHWTIIYNQGFEVTLNYRKFFAFSAYEQKGQNVTSFCHKTLPGWSHDVLGNNWACYTGQKATERPIIKKHTIPLEASNGLFHQNPDAIQRINSMQNQWTARHYPQFEGKPLREIYRMKGGPKSRINSPPKPAPVTEEILEQVRQLPDHFDWRNVSGVNFVSPVRNQGGCGSCYSFSSVGMIENRIRVMTNNSEKVELSPQDIVSCSEYSQGCEGGFPYLIAGKYAQDFGMVPEECFPYQGLDSQCKEKKCRRYYTAHYNYVGGFYGACNEELMRLALVRGGPLSVSFEVYDDFMSYASGVYHHTGVTHGVNNFDPFAITNHAVLAVGYGVDAESGQKYWIVKNSWGTGWGEMGYFRIRRGNNECNIESIAVEASPIP